MEDLLERIQASEEEIKIHLETNHACQVEGSVTLYMYTCICCFNYQLPDVSR